MMMDMGTLRITEAELARDVQAGPVLVFTWFGSEVRDDGERKTARS